MQISGSFKLSFLKNFLPFIVADNVLEISIIFVFLQAGKYIWLTYREVYDLVLKVGASIRVCGVKQVSHSYFKVEE